MNYYGTEVDLIKSPYFFEVDGYTFYFSTIKRKERFKRRYKYYSKNLNNYILSKYNILSDLSIISYIYLYEEIEKNGFIVKYNNKLIKRCELCVTSQLKIKEF